MNNLGGLQAKGLGVPHDTRGAYQWYRAVAKADNSVGVLNLASAYLDGETDGGVEALSSWSEIAPWKAASADLQEPTFGRTLWKGASLPEGRREEIREAARTQAIIPLQQAMQPDARLPTFHQVWRREAETPQRK
jgi:TPR repeat protein